MSTDRSEPLPPGFSFKVATTLPFVRSLMSDVLRRFRRLRCYSMCHQRRIQSLYGVLADDPGRLQDSWRGLLEGPQGRLCLLTEETTELIIGTKVDRETQGVERILDRPDSVHLSTAGLQDKVSLRHRFQNCIPLKKRTCKHRMLRRWDNTLTSCNRSYRCQFCGNCFR